MGYLVGQAIRLPRVGTSADARSAVAEIVLLNRRLSRFGPVARPCADAKLAAASDPDFEAVVTRRRSLRDEAQDVLRVQFSAEFFDCVAKRFLAGEWERCASGRAGQSLGCVRLAEARQLANSAKDIHLLLCRTVNLAIVFRWRGSVYCPHVVVGDRWFYRPR